MNAGLLIEAAEHVEETVVNDDMQPVELDPYAQQNDSLLDSPYRFRTILLMKKYLGII